MKYIVALAEFTTLAFSAPHIAYNGFPDMLSVSDIDGATTTDYSSNWAGIYLDKAPSAAPFTAVSATFTVPKPTPPPNAKKGTTYAATAWVGIDGVSGTKAILQTGIIFSVEAGSGDVSYDCWYEWLPLASQNFPGCSVHAGDVVVVSVNSLSPSKGVAKIHNKRTDKTFSTTITAPDATSTLEGLNAEWIVEDYTVGDSLVPFADFNKVVFTNPIAVHNGGQSRHAGDGGYEVMDMTFNNGSLKAQGKIVGSTVVVVYE